MDKLISEIADDEKVARILFSPSHIYKGRVSPKAFKLEKLKSGAEDYISVLRYNADQLDSVSAVFRPRTKGDSRYGFTISSSPFEAIGLPKCQVCTHCFDGSSAYTLNEFADED